MGLWTSSPRRGAVSEKKTVDACTENLGVTVAPSEIERAHRLGRFLPGKKRPIIVTCVNYKSKENILRHAGGFKQTNLSVAEDYSASTRLARNKLVEYGRSLNTAFKLRFDKLIVGNQCFTYNVSTNSIVEIQKN